MSRRPGDSKAARGAQQRAGPVNRRGAAALPQALTSEYHGVRSLHLDSIWIQGSMRIAEPDYVELDYVQRMLAGLLWLPPSELGRGRAVQLGLGAGALTRFCLKVLGMHCTVVELNPAVIALCRRAFHLPGDGPKLQVLCQDAAVWVADPAHRRSAQLLHVDLYDDEAAAPVLDDAGFYANCHEALDDGGVMSVNLFGRDASFEASWRRLAEVFGVDRTCRLRPTREGNTVVLAWRGGALPARDILSERAANIQTRYGAWGVPALKWLRMLRPEPPIDLDRKAAAP
jgi:spermidine synthase